MASHYISMQGIGASCLSAKAGSGLKAGWPCAFSQNNTVTNTAMGGRFHGVVVGIRDGLATVQYTGFVTLPYTGTAPGVGTRTLVADGAGGVKTDNSGGSYTVASVDTIAKTVTFLI